LIVAHVYSFMKHYDEHPYPVNGKVDLYSTCYFFYSKPNTLTEGGLYGIPCYRAAGYLNVYLMSVVNNQYFNFNTFSIGHTVELVSIKWRISYREPPNFY
jgi:hypothetical protein